jgi:UDP-N-acetylglucosamine 3-dehydrogenase
LAASTRFTDSSDFIMPPAKSDPLEKDHDVHRVLGSNRVLAFRFTYFYWAAGDIVTFPMRVGVVGVGSMGQNHVRVLSEISQLVGVADTNVKIGAEVSNRFSVSFFMNYKDLLKERLDAVVIAAPTDLHYEMVSAALSAGLHVLVEKPITSSYRQAEKLVEKAEDLGLILAVGHIERHNPVVGFAKKALAGNEYGHLITASTRRVSSLPERVRDVGVIMDLGIHDIDVLRHLIGSPVKSVYTLGGREKHAMFEDHANILMSFENGVTGFVEVNWLTPMKVRKLSLTCLKNFVELDYTTQSVTISSSTLMKYDPFNLYQVPFEYDIRQVSLQKREPLRLEIEDFLGAIKSKRKPLATGRDAMETLRVAEAALRSQKRGAVVKLD